MSFLRSPVQIKIFSPACCLWWQPTCLVFDRVWPQWRRQSWLLIWSSDTHWTLYFCNCTSLDSSSPQGTFLEGLQTVVLMSNYVHTKVNISLQFNSRQQICRVQMLLGVDKYSGKSQQPVNWKSNRIVRTRRTLANYLAKNVVFRKQSLALDLCLPSPIQTQLSLSCNEWLH